MENTCIRHFLVILYEQHGLGHFFVMMALCLILFLQLKKSMVENYCSYL